MEESKLKKVEEAIVILKSNKKVEKLEKIDKDVMNKTNKTQYDVNKKDFVVKEAELVVTSYISKIENNNKANKQKKIEQNKKVRRLKNYAYLSSLIIFLQLMLLIIK